jgi:hypothetical protein
MFRKIFLTVVGLLAMGTVTTASAQTVYNYNKDGTIASKTVTTKGKKGQDVIWIRTYTWGKCGKYYDWVEKESHFWKKEADGKWHYDGALPGLTEAELQSQMSSSSSAASSASSTSSSTTSKGAAGPGATSSAPSKTVAPKPLPVHGRLTKPALSYPLPLSPVLPPRP